MTKLHHISLLVIVAVCCIQVNLPRSGSHEVSERQSSTSPWWKAKFSHVLHDLSNHPEFINLADIDPGNGLFKELLNPILKPRVPGTPGHRQVREYIVETMSGLGWAVDLPSEVMPLPNGNSHEFINIVATYDIHAPRRLVLACHYDSLRKPAGFIGATDSAVPCAMMLHVAQTMTPYLESTKGNSAVTLQFIFFDGEEAWESWTSRDSLYGSRSLALMLSKTQYPFVQNFDRGSKVTTALHRMDMMVLLDLIGAANPTFPNFFSSTTGRHHKRMAQIESKLKRLGKLSRKKGKYFVPGSVWTGGIEDDHIPFLNRGVPILHLISYPFPIVWHTRNDNERALDYGSIRDVMMIVRIFVAEYLHLFE